jgi:catalase (peroxidase I)
MKLALALAALVASSAATFASAQCPFYNLGTPPPGHPEVASPASAAEYKQYLSQLDIAALYRTVESVMYASETCWPADGPQDGDKASYAGFFGRLAWHCAGTLRIVDDTSYGGCSGGGIRFWPEREWRDNGNLDQARAILAKVKAMPEYQQLSWGDLITFAGTVGIKASGGPADKFCFGRVDATDGDASIQLGVEGVGDSAGMGVTASVSDIACFPFPLLFFLALNLEPRTLN